MATLKDVAKLAHCDVSTVSRALNNSSHVHPETRARVMAAVEQLSYKPNVLVKGLSKGKRNTLGIVIPRIQLSIFADVVTGIEAEAHRNGYATLISTTRDNAEREKEELNRLRSGFIDGMIIAGTGKNNRLIRSIRQEGIPVTQIIRYADPLIGGVYLNYEQIGYKATQRLLEQGSRHIGIINGSLLISPYKDRLKGYQRAMKEADLETIVVDIDTESRGMEYGYDCALKMIDQNVSLDGILAATDAQGIGVLRALKENGIACPDKVRVISMTGYSVGSMLETSLTSVEMPASEIGVRAVKMNLEEIRRKPDYQRERPHQIVLDAEIVARESG